MRVIRTEVVINATAERVWEVLTDFAAYERWNPSIRSIRGVPRPGEQLTLAVALPFRGTMPVPVTVLQADPPRHLRWVGEAWVRALFRGEHSFTIESLGSRQVRVVQVERFTGLIVPLLAYWINGHTRRGFEAACKVLKLVAEEGATEFSPDELGCTVQ